MKKGLKLLLLVTVLVLLMSATGCAETKSSQTTLTASVSTKQVQTVKMELSETKYTYDGTKKTPKIFVYDEAGELISETYYTITYQKGRIEPGTYKIWVKFNENDKGYSGNLSKTITIRPKGTSLLTVGHNSLNELVLSWKKGADNTNGYQVIWSEDPDFKIYKTKTFTGRSGTTGIVRNVDYGKKYYVKIRTYSLVDGERVFSRWTSSKAEYAHETWKEQDVTVIPNTISTIKSDSGDKLILVNKLHAVSSDYKPADMVSVNGSYSTNQGLTMKKEAYNAFLKMRKAAINDGVSFKICSAYRSYSTQTWLYNNFMKTRGKEFTYLRSAYPGRSEHHTGYAIDLTSKSMGWGLSQDFINYPEGKWVAEHCAEYGFIVRYPKDKTEITGYAYEPWHLRYVGVEIAKEITESGLTLEEYLEG